LQVLVRGAVSLYRYADEWWIEKERQGLLALVNEEREIIVNSQRVKKYTNQHLGTLNTLMFDCMEIRPELQSVSLNAPTLVSLVTRYNRCKGSDAKVFTETKSWRGYRVGIIAGLNMSTLKLTSNKEGWAHTVGTFDPSNSMAFGVTLSFRTSKTNRNYSFTGSLIYSATESNNYVVISNISYTTYNWVRVSLQELKVPLGLRYTFSNAKVSPFVNAGISATFHLSKDALWKQQYNDSGGTTIRHGTAFEIRGNQLGVWAGAGLAFSLSDKLDATLEARYELTGGISDSPGLRSTVNNVQIFFGLRKW
jgi:opacity protein-like surface antigen